MSPLLIQTTQVGRFHYFLPKRSSIRLRTVRPPGYPVISEILDQGRFWRLREWSRIYTPSEPFPLCTNPVKTGPFDSDIRPTAPATNIIAKQRACQRNPRFQSTDTSTFTGQQPHGLVEVAYLIKGALTGHVL